MSSTFVALMLSASTISFPAPKDKLGALPPDLLDLVPADTAALLLVDVPKVAKSPIGKHFVKQLTNSVGDSKISVQHIVDDVQFAVVAQFDIVNFAGDFCMILRLHEKSTLVGKVLELVSVDEPFARIDGRAVYKLDNPTEYFAAIDRRTLVFVSLTNNPTGDELKASLQSAFARPDGKKHNEALRKKLEEIPFDDAVAVVSAHPKSSNSLGVAMAPLNPGGAMDLFKDRVTSYRGGIRVGEKADYLMEIIAANANAASDIAFTLRSMLTDDPKPRLKTMDVPARITRDKERVTMQFSIDEPAIRLLFSGEK